MSTETDLLREKAIKLQMVAFYKSVTPDSPIYHNRFRMISEMLSQISKLDARLSELRRANSQAT